MRKPPTFEGGGKNYISKCKKIQLVLFSDCVTYKARLK